MILDEIVADKKKRLVEHKNRIPAIKIALLGLGTVGSGVLKIIKKD